MNLHTKRSIFNNFTDCITLNTFFFLNNFNNFMNFYNFYYIIKINFYF